MFKFIGLLADIIIIGVFVYVFGSVAIERFQKWWQFSTVREWFRK